MGNNSFGRLFTVTTFGESHGPAIGCVVDGCPARIPLSAEDIQPMLDRRRPGHNPAASQRRESDRVEILSGLYEGMTTGHPVCLLIKNEGQRSADYDAIADVFRPGHADGVYQQKYGIRDPRGGGRSSARETAGRVAAAAVAKKMLAALPEGENIRVRAALTELGGIAIDAERWRDGAVDANANPLFCSEPEVVQPLMDLLDGARERGESVGGIIEVLVDGAPVGLGEPVYDKLDARIAHACMGLNAVKAVEIGDGFAAARAVGSQNNDPMRAPASGKFADAFQANHAGGILGGISTGQQIVVRVGVKPTPSIFSQQKTVNHALENADISVGGRHDPAVAVRAVPVVEAMLWLVLADFVLLDRARRR